MRAGIAKANGRKVLLKKGGNTQDIIHVILDTIPGVREQTKQFAKTFTADRAGMYKLWAWVRQNIRYKEDGLGVQWVREPARLWHDREGDCKSFTLFTISVLENLGIKYKVRFSNTETPGSKVVNHVYPLAFVGGKWLILDSVYPFFNAEKAFHYAKDYTMPDIYRLSGIGAAADTASLQNYMEQLNAASADIDDSLLNDDITEMTEGGFARFQQAQHFAAQAESATDETERGRLYAAAEAVKTGNLAGIGAFSFKDAQKIAAFIKAADAKKKRAFMPPVVVVPEGIAGISGIGDAIKRAWRKIVNWVFKQAMPAAAPFFLYTFLTKKVGAKTEKRRKRQDAVLNWVMKAGKFEDKQAVINAARTGIIRKYGKSPSQLLNAVAKGQRIAGDGIGSFAAIAIGAISWVIKIVSKIVSLFNKKAPAFDESDAANETELSTELAAAGNMQDISNLPGASGQGDNNMLFGALLIGGALILANR